MFDRLDDSGRKAMELAREEALRLGHDFIGTEHILLGLIRGGSTPGRAAAALAALGVDLAGARAAVEELVGRGTAADGGQLPFTPRAKDALEASLRHARGTAIRTEHLLLALLDVPEGQAVRVLRMLEVSPADVRTKFTEADSPSRVSWGPSTVFQRFTDRARKVMGLARQEAQRFNHDYIGTEHILLGLVQEGSGVAASVLKNLDVDLKKIRQEVEKLVSTGTTMVTVGQLPFTLRMKEVLALSLDEASSLGHAYVGTEHLLLGLIRESQGIAAQVLRTLNVKVEDVRGEVLELLGADPAGSEGRPPPGFLTRKNVSEKAAPLYPKPPGHPALFGAVAEEALGHAIGLARVLGGDVEPLHVFLGIVHAARSYPELAERTRGTVDLTTFAAHEDRIVAGRDREFLRADAPSRRVDLAPATLAVLSVAIGEAAARADSIVHVDDLLVALLSRGDGEPSRLLREAGVDPAAVLGAVRAARRPRPETPPGA